MINILKSKVNTIGIIVATLFLAVIANSCGNIQKSEKAEKVEETEPVPESNDLLLKETGSNSMEKIYVYDDKRNLEYEMTTMEEDGKEGYILHYYLHDKDGLLRLDQSVSLLGSFFEGSVYGELGNSEVSNYEIYNYDQNGNCIYKEENNGDHYEYKYDENNRLTFEVQVCGGNKKGTNYATVYEYDDNNQLVEKHSYKNAKDSVYYALYEYDSTGNKTKETLHYDGTENDFITTFQYDSAGKLIEEKSNNTTYKYKYDDKGHLIQKTNGKLKIAYTYITDPKDSKENLDKIKEIFDTNELEANAKDILHYYFNVIEDSSEREDNQEEQEISLNAGETVYGDLPKDILATIRGHYRDDYGDTVDIFSENRMFRFVLGGHDDHTYDEKICGYIETENGVVLLVEWNNCKYTYSYSNDGKTERLYLGPDGWNPNLNPYEYESSQVYIKEKSDDNSNRSGDDEYYYPWGIGDAEDGGFSYHNDIYEKIKGTYYVNGEDITIKFISPEEIEYTQGADKYKLHIIGCESNYNELAFGACDDYGEYGNTFMIMYTENPQDIKIFIGSDMEDSSEESHFDYAAIRG